MRQTHFKTLERKLEEEKRIKYKGTACIALEWLRFPIEDSRYLDRLDVEDTVSRLNQKGWLHPTSRYHVPAVISQEQLDRALQASGTSSTALLGNAQDARPKIQFPTGFKLECLHGWQLPTGLETPELKWWTVELYLDDISDELRLLITDEYYHEEKYSDGQIYRKIRQYQLDWKPAAEARWWERLSKNKRLELKRLQRRDDFVAAFDMVLDIPGLWLDGLRLGVTKAILDSKCDEENLHYLNQLGKFWTDLFQNDKDAMKKADYASVKELELKAPGASVSDAASILYKLKEGQIFSAFSLDYRMKLWVKLQKLEGLVPTLCSFFDDFNYLQSCAECMKRLVNISFKGTLFKALEQGFAGRNQTANAYTVQESESVISVVPGNSLDRVDLHYRQLFLFIMRHLRELSPESVLIEPRKSDKRPRLTKDPDKTTIHRLANLAEQLGFETPQIMALKSSSSAPSRTHPKKYKPSLVMDGPGELIERRAGRPFDLAHEQSKDYLFIDNMHSVDKGHGRGITPFFVRKSVYLAFFGRPTPRNDCRAVNPPTRIQDEPRIYHRQEQGEQESGAVTRNGGGDDFDRSTSWSQERSAAIPIQEATGQHNVDIPPNDERQAVIDRTEDLSLTQEPSHTPRPNNDFEYRQSIAASSRYFSERDSVGSGPDQERPSTLLLNGAYNGVTDLGHALVQYNTRQGSPEWERYAGELQDISTMFDVTPLSLSPQPPDSQAGDDLQRLLEFYGSEERPSVVAPLSHHSSDHVSEVSSSYTDDRLMLTYPSQDVASGEEDPVQQNDMEQNFVEPSILSSSFYTDEDEEEASEGVASTTEADEILSNISPIIEPMPAKEFSRQVSTANLAKVNISEKTLDQTNPKTEEHPQSSSTRVKFILRDGDKLVNVDEFSAGPAEHAVVKRKAEEHLYKGRHLFDSDLWSLCPSECLDAAVASGTNTIFLIPTGRIRIN